MPCITFLSIWKLSDLPWQVPAISGNVPFCAIQVPALCRLPMPTEVHYFLCKFFRIHSEASFCIKVEPIWLQSYQFGNFLTSLGKCPLLMATPQMLMINIECRSLSILLRLIWSSNFDDRHLIIRFWPTDVDDQMLTIKIWWSNVDRHTLMIKFWPSKFDHHIFTIIVCSSNVNHQNSSIKFWP